MLRSIAFIFCLLLAALPARAGGYAGYAQSVTANLPEGAAFRPDLEEYLSARASAYRVKKRRRPLLASEQLAQAARAQAVDIMVMGRSGHRSRKGHGFAVRFKAFQEDPALTYSAGENAASDRRRGEANTAKADRLFQLWLDSTGHRKNMLGDQYVYVSTGVVQRGSELWAVQIFWGEPKKTNFFFGN
jgi:uncharacterized protein YkwD